MHAVSISNFYWKYPNFTSVKSDYALKGITLDINEGEFFGITGPSGSGKSTLCYAIAGLIPHQLKLPLNFEDNISGSIKVFGEEVTSVLKENGKLKISGKGSMAPLVGLVMQDPESQFLSMSVINEMSLGLQLMGIKKEEMESRIREAMEMVGLGELYSTASKIHPSELSGGQKQRLVIASFLAMRPKVLILDEPTSDLDPKGKMEVIETISRLKSKSDMTIILVEHNPEVMLRFAERIAVLHEGTLVACAPPSEIYSDKALTSKYNIYTPEVAELSDYFSIDEKQKVKIPDSGFRVNRDMPDQSNPIIKLKEVSFSYDDGTKALEGINLEIEKGSLVALVGQNGSGKSTLSKIISGILKPSYGEMEIAGIRPRSKKDRSKLPLHVSYVFQNPDHQIFTRSVTDEISYSLKNAGITGAAAAERISSILERVGLSDKASEDPVFLGRGQKRRLAVASSIVIKPEILIVDEPTTGQDYRMSIEIMDLIKGLNANGVTVLLITHDMRLVAEYCRRVVVMNRGSIVFDGTPETLFMDENLLKLSSLSEPQSVRLSKGLMHTGALKEPLISAREWLEFFDFLKSKTKIEFRSIEDVEKAASKIAAAASKRGAVESLIYIERGGMVLGSAIAKVLKCDSYAISASHYNSIGAQTKEVNVRGIDSLNIRGNGYILVVDELVDTGKTMKETLSLLLERFPKTRFLTCAMITKPHSIMKPDITVEEVPDDTWVVFDYERKEATEEFRKGNPELQEVLKGCLSSHAFGYSPAIEKIEKAAASAKTKPEAIFYQNPETALFARLASDSLGIKRLVPVSKVQPFQDKTKYASALIIGSQQFAEEIKTSTNAKEKIFVQF